MIHTYNVTGMTCNGCKVSVKKALSALQDVDKVDVDLSNSTATITMKNYIEESTLQNALSEKYTITEQNTKNVIGTTQPYNEKKSELKQLFPLFLIFVYIIIASILLNIKPWNTDGFMLDFMGLFYIIFSFFKLLDLKGFPQSFKMYDPLAKALPAYGWVYPFIEVALGLMFLMRFQVNIALISTLIVLGITTFGVTKTLLDKKSIQCACLGTALKLPMTKATFIENSIMIIMAFIMLFKTI
ncbi:heavy metal transporter [Winogradskyella sp. J14-2]|uniref:heavy metal translocating P-type ATPase n=1 Tax=Winogradskyella sp. J14-2 TaxID=1936080 RepID=UPI000972AF51|nr:heavy metal-associated domain-containing protein [Winogradskyella sp. J14-2]APY07821.1 heavy metal transporter [Winogradskyella sp. J14-2]